MPIRQRMFRTPAVKEFINRTALRKAFWSRYDKMLKEGSTIINFYGAGGVGKTALLKKMEEEVTRYSEVLNRPYVKYDFSIGTDVHDILKTFKFQLSDYGCDFPLFDIGSYYYSLTIGKDIEAPRVQSMFEQLPLVQEVKKKLSQVGTAAVNAIAVFSTGQRFFNAATEIRDEHWLAQFFNQTINGLGAAMPIMRTITIFMSAADVVLGEYLKRKGILDEKHQFIRNELNARRLTKDPVALYEYLPTLFAMDVTDWMSETGNKLIAFLDNYESLGGTINFTSPEQRKRDLWLRGDDGLIYNVPNTLWVIAGRNKLLWDGELADELEQHRIISLLPEDSNEYLTKAGISDENLRTGLVSLTNGYPIFLDLCVDVYFEYKRQHNDAPPPLKEFGTKREEVVGRIFRYIDAANDDAAKDMLSFLCVMNVWTDELACKIGGTALYNFSLHTYKRVKSFSFIQSENIKNADLNLKLFRFDYTIQNLFVATCDKFLISNVKKAVNNYFKKFFTSVKTLNAKEIFYLKLWAEFIVNSTDDAAELLTLYKKFLAENVLNLASTAHFDAAEKIFMLFMNKLESLCLTDELPYTYFELDFSSLLRAQGKYKESFAVTSSAYEKRTGLLGDENSETIEAMHHLAISLNDLGRYKEAIKFHRQVLNFRKNSLGEENPETIEAMHHLATSLNDLGQYDEALELRKKVLATRKNIQDNENEDTFNAINNLAVSLSAVGRYKEAYDRRKEALALSKKICGDEHPDTIAAMNNLSVSLSDLKRYEEALMLQEQVLSLYENILGKKHPNTLIAMNNLSVTLSSLKRYEEALELQKEILDFSKKFFGAEYPNTVAFMNNLAMSFSILERYEEALPLQEQVLKSYTKIFGEENPYVIIATDNLALSLTILKRYDEVLPLREKILSFNKKNLGEENETTLESADKLAYILNKLGHHQKAIDLLRDTLDKCEKIFGKSHAMTVTVEKNLAEILSKVDTAIKQF